MLKKLILILIVLFANIQSIVAQEVSSEIIANQGFTLNSFLRGLLGMFVLILISYLLSANRKAINWRTVPKSNRQFFASLNRTQIIR